MAKVESEKSQSAIPPSVRLSSRSSRNPKSFPVNRPVNRHPLRLIGAQRTVFNSPLAWMVPLMNCPDIGTSDRPAALIMTVQSRSVRSGPSQ